LHLEEALHHRVIGQEAAVVAVASALRRARANMRSEKRPIASFLFLGPTGVGKTELAKATAATFFGNEQAMVRFDMSEFQSADSAERLIGRQGEAGLLTEAVRRQPFALVLLDELEKADAEVLNLFLQVVDDGE
jgi:ATP-dependent Clp protease ATP-binding subunit ClpC